jgi:predicted DNA-binding transcriptional regulator YafY
MAFKDRPYFRRTLDFHDLLKSGKPVTASSLSKRWETSTKTVQRFIDAFRNEFDAPVEWDARKATYRYQNEAYQLPWLAMDGAELFAIGVAMKVLQMYEGTPAAKDLQVVLNRLAQIMPKEVRVHPSTLVEKLYVRPQAVRPVDPGVWKAIAAGLRDKVALDIRYRKPAGEDRQRRVEPYYLVLGGGDWFLLARDPEDGKVKTFYVTRIKSAALTAERFQPPKGFKPEEHFGETIGLYVGKDTFRFRVRFSAEIAPWIEEVHWHAKQKLVKLPDGQVDLELPAGSLLEARRFVLSFGKHARVLEPKELVADVRGHVAELAGMYGS